MTRDIGKNSKYTIKDYVDGIKSAPEFFWEVGTYKNCHGDCKSTVAGMFRTRSQKSSFTPTEYMVMVTNKNKPVLTFTMPGKDRQPSDEEVLTELKRRVLGAE